MNRARGISVHATIVLRNKTTYNPKFRGQGDPSLREINSQKGVYLHTDIVACVVISTVSSSANKGVAHRVALSAFFCQCIGFWVRRGPSRTKSLRKVSGAPTHCSALHGIVFAVAAASSINQAEQRTHTVAAVHHFFSSETSL